MLQSVSGHLWAENENFKESHAEFVLIDSQNHPSIVATQRSFQRYYAQQFKAILQSIPRLVELRRPKPLGHRKNTGTRLTIHCVKMSIKHLPRKVSQNRPATENVEPIYVYTFKGHVLL